MEEIWKQRDHLEYPELTMFQMVERIAKQYPEETALDFFDRRTSYAQFLARIEQAARAFAALGIGKGDVVTICMPNTPQAVTAFYALNRIGAVANMVHPLSAVEEVQFYLRFSKTKVMLSMDLFAERAEEAIAAVEKEGQQVRLIVARMQDELPALKKIGFALTKGRSFYKYPTRKESLTWRSFLELGKEERSLPEISFDKTRTSVILYSGGTSGTPKGICLSDLNFNALAMQAKEAIGMEFGPGLKMLSCMPCFHGFGLGINIHTVLVHGVTSILMPTFTSRSYAEMLLKKRPNFIAGVPTIFEALLHLPQLDGQKLDFLMGMFCGGDSLTPELKKKIDAFLSDHGATIQVREGYGLTECVTASCLTPRDVYREGSIGIPFPDTEYRIAEPGTEKLLEPGREGEILVSGPTLMLGYLDNPEETANTLRTLHDGKTWLYTGDLGWMDEDGYVYFRQRIKRMIITNGYNVYPGQIENAIDSCEEVAYSCVIGVKDPRRMQRVRAYVVLKEGVEGDDACRKRIMDQISKKVAGYALPKEMIFRKDLPKTLVGKVAFRKLEEEAEGEKRAVS